MQNQTDTLKRLLKMINSNYEIQKDLFERRDYKDISIDKTISDSEVLYSKEYVDNNYLIVIFSR